jgi:aminodeoxyfutalosine deaminase
MGGVDHQAKLPYVFEVNTDDFIARLPKVDLHVHLCGSATAATLRRLSVETDVLPRLGERTFAGFAAAYGAAERLVRSGADIVTLLDGLTEQFLSTRVRYAEVTVTALSHLANGLAADELGAALERGRVRASKRGVELGWVFDCSGELGAAAAERTVDWVLRHAPANTVGFGVGGPEAGVPRAQFRPAFERARAAGLHSVPHAGETAGAHSVWTALRELHAERIGHGIRSVDDQALLEHLASTGVTLEVCPTSNLRTGAVASLAEHPLTELLEAGVRVTLGTDNPGLLAIDLDHEYRLAHRTLGLSRQQLIRIAEAGVEAAFCSPALRRELTGELRRLATRRPAAGSLGPRCR